MNEGVLGQALTLRQTQVVDLIVRFGDSNKIVGGKLGMTEGTVKAHLYAVFAKLGIHCRAQLVRRMMA